MLVCAQCAVGPQCGCSVGKRWSMRLACVVRDRLPFALDGPALPTSRPPRLPPAALPRSRSRVSLSASRLWAAEREGKPPPSRPSICDCVSTCGLNKRATPCAEEIPEQTLYEHLVQLGTPRIVVEGREARQLPFTSGECASFLRGVDGRIVCRHGRLRASLMHMRAAGNRARCSCMPSNFPTRLATRELTAPEKRNSAEKRKRIGGGRVRTSKLCEAERPTAPLIELPTARES